MPTLEERTNETSGERDRRIEARTIEMGITYTFSTYLEQLETYLLQLEQRVRELESRNGIKKGD